MNLSEMYLTMIRNSYSKGSIEELEAIRETINLTPMKYIIMNHLSLSSAYDLVEIINTKIDTLKLKKKEEE